VHNYLQTIKDVIANKTGLEPEEVTKDSFFEDDLNIGEMELIEILEELEDVYHTELTGEREDLESIQNLIDLLAEKLD
jgi:acyl carrier protein